MRYCTTCNKVLNSGDDCYYIENTGDSYCYNDDVECVRIDLENYKYSKHEIEKLLDRNIELGANTKEFGFEVIYTTVE